MIRCFLCGILKMVISANMRRGYPDRSRPFRAAFVLRKRVRFSGQKNNRLPKQQPEHPDKAQANCNKREAVPQSLGKQEDPRQWNR